MMYIYYRDGSYKRISIDKLTQHLVDSNVVGFGDLAVYGKSNLPKIAVRCQSCNEFKVLIDSVGIEGMNNETCEECVI